jgi:hypothetical protein
VATRCDLNGIKSQISTILLAANTTTASPIDLSAGMTKRVNKVLKINPQLIPPQISFYPFVTCYVTAKSMEQADMALDQINSKKKSKIELEIAAGVLNENFSVDTEDPADEDINYLMENIELTLRSNPTLNSKVLWQISKDVKYYTANLDEQTHLRAGILTLEGTVFY